MTRVTCTRILSRQAIWQQKRIAEGKCQTCGAKRGKGYEDKTRCKACLRADADRKQELTEQKAEGVR